MLKIFLGSILLLIVAQHCWMMVAPNQANKETQDEELLDNFRKHFSGDKEIHQALAGTTKEEQLRSLQAYQNELRAKRQDYVTHEELDEAVSTLTSMIDVLSAQMMTLAMDIMEIKDNSVKRCEVGTRYLQCEWSCCKLDHSDQCTFRDYYTFYLNTTFSAPFDGEPIVSVSADANWKYVVFPIPPITSGFSASPAHTITPKGFNVTMHFDIYQYQFLEEMYTVSWIACL